MAETPRPQLAFAPGCPDCGRREVQLPGPLPPVGDDFDWQQRDYDSIRLAMLEELIARFPERPSWRAADMEVVLVEALAVVLDQLSDQLDRAFAEAFLDTARNPQSVRRLLGFIGYDALAHSALPYDPTDPASLAQAQAALEREWLRYPERMDEARRAGPRAVHTNRRMVSQGDYATVLDDHPLVARAQASSHWGGAWQTLELTVINLRFAALDDAVLGIFAGDPARSERLRTDIDRFHRVQGLRPVPWHTGPSLRSVLRLYLERYRMAGQEVWLRDAVPVGIEIGLTVRVGPSYYRSEVRQGIEQALGTGLNGFFAPGRLAFGEDLYASDLIETVMALAGVEALCLERFKRLGRRYANQAEAGRIRLDGVEVGVCDNDPAHPERGLLRLRLHGGQPG